LSIVPAYQYIFHPILARWQKCQIDVAARSENLTWFANFNLPQSVKTRIQILRRCSMQQQALRDLYIDELRDIYNAETQLLKALPKMAKAATSDELRSGFEEHLEQTRGHVSRLEQIFEDLDEKPSGKKCAGMEGLVKEGGEMIKSEFEGEVKDAGLIGAAQRVEHYEIAAYGTVRAFAELLGDRNAVDLLSQTLEEEKETDKKLTQLASEINVEASQSEGASEDEPSGRRKSKTAHA
jgi:ferritin-like metal-binding protein YciE